METNFGENGNIYEITVSVNSFSDSDRGQKYIGLLKCATFYDIPSSFLNKNRKKRNIYVITYTVILY